MNRSGSAVLASEAPSKDKKISSLLAARNVLCFVTLITATVVLYFSVRSHPFFNPDDWFYLTGNNHVQAGLTWSTLSWAFRCHFVNWHPLTWISHAVDFQLFGLNPAGHHLENVFFHVVNAALLYWMLYRATGYMGRSFMVAAVFALHPINVEPVVWIAERKTMLSTTFFLLALAAYQWYVERPGERRFWTMAGLFVVGLLAKPQIITFPFVLLLWDYWPLNRLAPPNGDSRWKISKKEFYRLVNEKIPLFFFAAADAMVTLTAQGVTQHDYHTYPLSVRLENAIVSYVRYIGKALWPVNLAPFYPHPGHSLAAWQVIGSLAILLIITAFVFYKWRERYLPVGWLWFLGTMIPMIGIVQVGDQAMADRYGYQPFIGLYIMVCWGIAEACKRIRVPVRVTQLAGAIALACLFVLAYRQIDDWKDDLSIWSHTLAVTGDNVVVEYHLAQAYPAGGSGEAAAMEHYQKAHTLAPQDPYINLQLALHEQIHRDFAGAIHYYQLALKTPGTDPQLVKSTYLGMASAYRGLEDSAKARECEEAAHKVVIDPDLP